MGFSRRAAAALVIVFVVPAAPHAQAVQRSLYVSVLNDAGAPLLQGIIEVCTGFKKREAARPVIVAVTTEGPELSDRYYDLALEPLLASGAAFHAIVLGPPRGGTSDAARDRGMVLDRGTRE